MASALLRSTLGATRFTITRPVVVHLCMPLDDGLAHHGLIFPAALLR